MDYIVPGNVTDAEFRQMWFDFEWENKVTVNTPITDLREFLHYLSTVTNMKVLTGDAAIEGDCGFLAANLCAHSIFGEDALANVSIEKASPLDEGSPIVGHIRIRAKSQGMALTLGDKINIAQRDRRAVAVT
ncbi:coatamer beta region [Cooperia oncophora]